MDGNKEQSPYWPRRPLIPLPAAAQWFTLAD